MSGDGAEAAERSAKLRAFYAVQVTRVAGVREARIQQAFAAVPRERFAGPAPWYIATGLPVRDGDRRSAYLPTPDDDPAFVYQNVLVALDPDRGINIGEPSLHARCLDALAPQLGEHVLHVGAGSGYYTAILAELVGPRGQVYAYEIDPDLAARAQRNLSDRPAVEVRARSGLADDLPPADVVYVSAGITQPSLAWLEALRPGGRLLFPLQPGPGSGGWGAMLLVGRPDDARTAWPARFVCRAGFIPCAGPQDAATGDGLATAFAAGGWEAVDALHLDDAPDASCWFAASGWWLSGKNTGAAAG